MTDDLESLGPFHPESQRRRDQDTPDLLSIHDDVAEFRKVKHDFGEILSRLQQQTSLTNEKMARRLKVNVEMYSEYFTKGHFDDKELVRVMRSLREAFSKEKIMLAVDAFYADPEKPNPLASVFDLPLEIQAKLPKRTDSRPPRRTALLQYLFPADEVR